MRRLLTLLFATTATLFSMTASAEPSINVTISNMHIWRGDEVADGLVVTTDAHLADAKDRIKVGFWGGANAIGAYKEFNYYINYKLGGFTFNLCDTYNFSEYASYNNEEFFNYHADQTGRFLDASVSYKFGEKFPVTLQWATILFGRDRNAENSANRYSTFCSATYPVYKLDRWQIDLGVGCAFALKNIDEGANFFGSKAGVVEATVKLSYIVMIRKYELPISATAMLNPQTNKGYLQFSAQVITF